MKTRTPLFALLPAVVVLASVMVVANAAPNAQTATATAITPYDACVGAPKSRLVVGSVTMVSVNPPLPNNVRRAPNLVSDRLGQIQPGEIITVVEGPQCSDGYVWWKVQGRTLIGWTIEGDTGGYWLVPPATATPSRTPSPTRTPRTPTSMPNATGTRQTIDRLSTATVEAARARATQAALAASSTRAAIAANQTATRVAAPTRTAQARIERTATQKAVLTARVVNATATAAQATQISERRIATAISSNATATVAAQATFARATQLAGCRRVQWSGWRYDEKISYRGYIYLVDPEYVILYTSTTERLVLVSLPNTEGLQALVRSNIAVTVCGISSVPWPETLARKFESWRDELGISMRYIKGEFWSK